MEQYLEKGKEVLKLLLNNGCEAYMIGEAVCNIIIGLPFENIEITTNATPDMIKGIFSQSKVEDHKEGSVHLTYMGYDFFVSTFRLEEKFKDNRKPLRLHYSKNLKDELAAREFTITAIAMSYGGKLTDAYKGYDDIRKKKIRTIGSAKIRFTENPLRILQALRLSCELGFKIETKTFKAMKKKARLLKGIEPSLMVNELTRILNGKYFKRSLKYIYESNVYKYLVDLKRGFNHLANNYKRISIDSFLACSYVLNKGYSTVWEDMCDDSARLRKVVELALANPKSKYDPYLLLKYGLEVCLDSNYVNYMLGKSKIKQKKIRKEFANLSIKSESDLNYTRNNLYFAAQRKSAEIDNIYDDVLKKVVTNRIKNDYNIISEYVSTVLNSMNINQFNEGQYYKESSVSIKEEVNTANNIKQIQVERELIKQEPTFKDDNNISKLEQIERRVDEYERSLREKDEKIKELERQALQYKLDNDLNIIVGQNLELLKDLNYIENGSEKLLVTKELKEVYRGLITNTDPKYRILNEKKEGKELGNEREN